MWYLCWVSFELQVHYNKDLFSRKFEVFNEMEMKINVINNKIFTKNIFKNKSMRKRNFMIYHFLIESNPHERVDLLITANVNICQTKKKYSNSNKNMLFWRKNNDTIWKPPLQRELPFQLTPLFLGNFFYDLPHCLNFKNNIAPPLLPPTNFRKGGEEETMKILFVVT